MDYATLVVTLQYCREQLDAMRHAPQAYRIERPGVDMLFMPPLPDDDGCIPLGATTRIRLNFQSKPSVATADRVLTEMFGVCSDTVHAVYSHRLPHRHAEVYRIDLNVQ